MDLSEKTLMLGKIEGGKRRGWMTEDEMVGWHHQLNGHVQFSSFQSCLTLRDPMDHSKPGLPVHHQLPESTQTHVHPVSDAIQPSHPLLSLSLPAFNLFYLTSGFFPVSQFFASGGQSIGVSASASVFPMNIQE